MILRRRGCGRDRRPRRGNVDRRLELLTVLLLLLLLGLLVIGTCAVPATSAPVEHPLSHRELPPRHLTKMSQVSDTPLNHWKLFSNSRNKFVRITYN